MRSVFKQKIESAYKSKEFIKIIFQYPNSGAIIKRGIVLEVFDDGFEIEEIKDGKVSYSYEYIVEIKLERELNG